MDSRPCAIARRGCTIGCARAPSPLLRRDAMQWGARETSASTPVDRVRCAQRCRSSAPAASGRTESLVRNRNKGAGARYQLNCEAASSRLAGSNSNLRSSREVMAGRAAHSGVFCLLIMLRPTSIFGILRSPCHPMSPAPASRLFLSRSPMTGRHRREPCRDTRRCLSCSYCAP